MLDQVHLDDQLDRFHQVHLGLRVDHHDRDHQPDHGHPCDLFHQVYQGIHRHQVHPFGQHCRVDRGDHSYQVDHVYRLDPLDQEDLVDLEGQDELVEEPFEPEVQHWHDHQVPSTRLV